MKKQIIAFQLIVCLLWSCTSDKESVDTFMNCMDESELKAYSNLVSVCDEFIKSNYPGDQLNDGYQKFLDGLLTTDPNTWKIDTVKVLRMNKELAKTFRTTYDADRANFLFKSSITQCLNEANRKRLSLKRFGLEKLLEDKKNAGELSPNIIASAMQAREISPTKGIGKTIFVTEVLWRLLYLNLTSTKSTNR